MIHHQQENKNIPTFKVTYSIWRTDRSTKNYNFRGVNRPVHIYTIHTYISEYSRKDRYDLEKELAEEFEKDMTQYVHILRR